MSKQKLNPPLEILDDLFALVPFVLPNGWKKLGSTNLSPVCFAGPKGLKAMMSVMMEEDGEAWMHVSMSHRDRLPTYEEMKAVKRIFIGSDKDAIQVFPKASNHVNVHPYCLHLWCCLSNPSKLPDFTRGLGMI